MNKDLICNCCGRTILVENNIPKEDFIEVTKEWGYFSQKDGTTNRFVLCERCIDELMKTFTVAAENYRTRELL